MLPEGGFAFVVRTSGWGENAKTTKHGPYRVRERLKLFEGSPNYYYDLEGLDEFVREDQLEPASKEEALYHKMTQHVEV